jgi:DNA-binding CsgD family transcriptional regulator
MTFSISGIYSAQQAVAPSPAPVSTQTALQPTQQTISDTVTLSQAAKVSQLTVQGESPSLIAGDLGITVATVNLDLGIVTAKATSKPTPVPVVAAPAIAPSESKPAAPLTSASRRTSP